MRVVQKVEDTKLERTVALKFLASHLLDNEEAKQRFLREAKAAAALHHPNIRTVHKIDEAEGKTFLAMAFLKGETLPSTASLHASRCGRPQRRSRERMPFPNRESF